MSNATPPHKRHALMRLLHDNPGNSAKTQQARIMQALQTLGNVTTPEMVRRLDCPRPGSRISELRDAGHPSSTAKRRFSEISHSGALEINKLAGGI